VEVEPAPAAAAPKPKEEEKYVKVKRTSSNAVVVHMSALSGEPVPSVGDPWYCKKCGAAVSSLSRLTKVEATTAWNW
jgi:hypothetical protein